MKRALFHRYAIRALLMSHSCIKIKGLFTLPWQYVTLLVYPLSQMQRELVSLFLHATRPPSVDKSDCTLMINGNSVSLSLILSEFRQSLITTLHNYCLRSKDYKSRANQLNRQLFAKAYFQSSKLNCTDNWRRYLITRHFEYSPSLSFLLCKMISMKYSVAKAIPPKTTTVKIVQLMIFILVQNFPQHIFGILSFKSLFNEIWNKWRQEIKGQLLFHICYLRFFRVS